VHKCVWVCLLVSSLQGAHGQLRRHQQPVMLGNLGTVQQGAAVREWRCSSFCTLLLAYDVSQRAACQLVALE
jgi:hypothetical protein